MGILDGLFGTKKQKQTSHKTEKLICQSCGHMLIDANSVDFQLKDVISYLHCKKQSGKTFTLDFFVSPTIPSPEEIRRMNPEFIMTIGCMEKGCKCTLAKP